MSKLPNDDWASLSPDDQRRLEKACTDFENAWKTGGRPRIEDYFNRELGETKRRCLLRELLELEVPYRRRAGEDPRGSDYRERFPSFSGLIDALFEASPKQSDTGADQSGDEDAPPSSLRQYRVICELGRGGFGIVYRAYDDDLQRDVAIKVPTRRRTSQPGYAEAYIAEARKLAKLDHPNIVRIHGFDRADNGVPFVVYEFIDGSDLRHWAQRERMSTRDSAQLVATVADALHHCHVKGIFHRDVKPANILVGRTGKPYVADFGLALGEEEFGRGPELVGTAQYMSPEQARYEGHRVDGRSDIFSLGVVFYELLARRRPFHGDTRSELLQQIATADVRPPRQIDDTIPKELERICLSALARRATERYPTARDMADDLRHFLAEQPPPPSGDGKPPPPPEREVKDEGTSNQSVVKIIPKGLRSFDAEDADFFLELVPGPRDRERLPDGVRFWKTRIAQTDPDKTFAVGLVYGPSGSGKSSLFKAGLLPQLADHVIAVYVEATADETETRLLNGLRKRCPALDGRLGLKQSLAALRRGHGLRQGQKVLIVLDQFEQWLHAQKDQENPELVQALRHCDGGRVQCIVMVRDDFWLAISRFMRELEVDLVPGKNIALVDLFDLDHAPKVLSAFGRAFERLPEKPGETSPEQIEFLRQAVVGLAQNNKIVCVRLALFAEMMKGRPWTPTALQEVGGTKGIGLTFLEDTFSSPTANPNHRLHQKAARAVLKALQPETGSDIKGNMKSREQLLAASGYVNRPKDFDALVRILDSELRLITPTDPEGKDADEGSKSKAESGRKYFQLTHDYLVHSLRDWLTRKQKETRRGRAELRLAERSALWNAKPENRRLPSLLEWANIRLFTHGRDRTPPQRKMLRRADGYYLVRGFAALCCLALVGWGAWKYRANASAHAFRDRLLSADIEKVPELVAEIGAGRRRVEPLLRESLYQENEPKRELNLRLGLMASDRGQLEPLLERMLSASPQEFTVIRQMVLPYKDNLTDHLLAEMDNRQRSGGSRFRAACALVAFLPRDHERRAACAKLVVNGLLAENPIALIYWKDALKPVKDMLLPALAESLEDSRWGDRDRRAIVEFYRVYTDGNIDDLQPLEERLDQLLARPDRDSAPQAKRIGAVAAALASLGKPDKVWMLLKHTPSPTIRSFLIDRLGTSGIDPNILTKRLIEEKQDNYIRGALVLACSAFSQDRLPELVPILLELYENDPDPGIHGAAAWLLRQWNQTGQITRIDEMLATGKVFGKRGWYVNTRGHTFTIIEQPKWFAFALHKLLKPRPHRFAICMTEVTVAQFRDFDPDHKVAREISTTDDSPVNMVKWYDAAAYCNWLSDKEGLQPCYYIKDGKPEFFADYLRRDGYRLPTEGEWEFACRAGTRTLWSFGEADEDLASRYARFFDNSRGSNGMLRAFPVGSRLPNDWGLFDMHGNVAEWCQELSLNPPEMVDGHLLCSGRGGTFYLDYRQSGYDRRFQLSRGAFSAHVGFRLVRTYPSAHDE